MPYKLTSDEIERTVYPNLWKRGQVLGNRYRFSNEDVEDLVMDTIESLINASDGLDASTNIQAYAERSLQNKFKDRWRQNQTRKTDSFSETEIDEVSSDDSSVFAKREYEAEVLEDVVKRIADLEREECRDILYLWLGVGTYSNIAAELGIQQGTVMSRLSRCKQELVTLCRSKFEHGPN